MIFLLHRRSVYPQPTQSRPSWLPKENDSQNQNSTEVVSSIKRYMLLKVIHGLLKLLLALELNGCTNPQARVTRGLNNHTKTKLMSFVDSSFKINLPFLFDSCTMSCIFEFL